VRKTPVVIWLLVLPVFGQEFGGTVQGTVTDPSGARIPQTDLTLKGIQTGITRSEKADGTGYYSFTFVLPGSYTLEATASKVRHE
jgi:hypothetical protein